MPLSPARAAALLADNVQRVIQGKPEVVRLRRRRAVRRGPPAAGGRARHWARPASPAALARSIGGRWSRIQFTPDLLPGDITGVMVYHQGTGTLRVPPRRHLRQRRARRRDQPRHAEDPVRAAGGDGGADRSPSTRCRTPVPRPFLVVATQNPIELDGTYRLPEAQLDRFLMRVAVGYPDHDAEVRVVLGDAAGVDPDALEPVLDLADARRGHRARCGSCTSTRRSRGYAVRAGRGDPRAPRRPLRRQPARQRRAGPRRRAAAAAIEGRSLRHPGRRQGRRARRARAPADPHPGGRAEPPVGRGACSTRCSAPPRRRLAAGCLTCGPTRRGVAVLGRCRGALVLGVVLGPAPAAGARRVRRRVRCSSRRSSRRARAAAAGGDPGRAPRPRAARRPAFAELVVRNRTHSRQPALHSPVDDGRVAGRARSGAVAATGRVGALPLRAADRPGAAGSPSGR